MKASTKVALISGITGQDGAYLANLLLNKNYVVHGIKRRSSLFNTARIDGMFNSLEGKGRLFLHYGDMTDSSNLIRLINEVQPDEIYNLAAQSHVKVSFETPEYTANADGIGTLRMLEAIRILQLEKKTKFYQASTSELFGKVQEIPQSERTPFYPRSPYAAAKLYSYWITVNYREAYGIFASNGILFNHESPLRGETFVTRKITRSIARMALGYSEILSLGNLDAERDWGHAKEYVEGMWRIMQAEEPEDFVLATGVTTKVREFLKLCFQAAKIPVEFKGSGLNEVVLHANTGKILVDVNPRYFRPTEVDLLVGNPEKAEKKLGWKPKISIKELAHEMIAADIYQLKMNDQEVSIPVIDAYNYGEYDLWWKKYSEDDLSSKMSSKSQYTPSKSSDIST